MFYELLDILSIVQNVEEFENAKKQISDKIVEYAKKVEAKEIPLTELAFNVMISKAPSEYVKYIFILSEKLFQKRTFSDQMVILKANVLFG